MLSLRNRFGIPGVISVIALVFAMMGGAYAASGNSGNGGGQATASADSSKRSNKRGQRNKRGKQGGLNAKQKRQVIALAKRFAGKQGPTGPQGFPGLPGAPGPKGADGDDGSDGGDGTNGKSVVATPAACGGLGGTEFEVEGSGEASTVCNGEDGETGFTATLPEGETLTGTFSGSGVKGSSSFAFIPASFNIPLASREGVTGAVFDPGATGPGCPGIAANGTPLADPGHFCAYEALLGSEGTGLTLVIDPVLGLAPEHGGKVNPGGAFVAVQLTGEAGQWWQLHGVWAVTAPEEE